MVNLFNTLRLLSLLLNLKSLFIAKNDYLFSFRLFIFYVRDIHPLMKMFYNIRIFYYYSYFLLCSYFSRGMNEI